MKVIWYHIKDSDFEPIESTDYRVVGTEIVIEPEPIIVVNLSDA